MPELTAVGAEAIARELFHLATNGERTWEQESQELRDTFRSFVDQIVLKASAAEDRAGQ